MEALAEIFIPTDSNKQISSNLLTMFLFKEGMIKCTPNIFCKNSSRS
jgi:hypothetical protein